MIWRDLLQWLKIFKRVSDVWTEIGEGFRIDPHITTATKYKMLFVINGTQLEARVLENDVTVYDSVIITDTTFSNSGTAEVNRYTGASGELRIDNFNAYVATGP